MNLHLTDDVRDTSSIADDASGESASFIERLLSAGLLIATEARGVYGRGVVFQDIVERFDALVMGLDGASDAQRLSFPPVVARGLIERMGYLESFPQLIGSVHGFRGTDAQARDMAAKAGAGERWEEVLEPSDVMLLPAACYPVYPTFSGLLPDRRRVVTVRGWCYRHEPSDEPTRLQSFQMRELICAGSPDQVERWRDEWLERSLELLRELGLPAESDVANDPFFGRAGRLLSATQREQKLKFEILCAVNAGKEPTAICSFNWHQEHFSAKYRIRQSNGDTAHTACLGFGLERIALALLATHGLAVERWPDAVRAQLWR